MTSASACEQVRHERGEEVVVAVADLVVGDRVVLVDDGEHAEIEQALQRLAGVEVLAAVHEVVRREQHLAADDVVAREKIVFSRSMRRGWPTAASACSVPTSVGGVVSPSAGIPAAIAPDSTSTTRCPALCAAARSPHSFRIAASSSSPRSSVIDDVPTFTTASMGVTPLTSPLHT